MEIHPRREERESSRSFRRWSWAGGVFSRATSSAFAIAWRIPKLGVRDDEVPGRV